MASGEAVVGTEHAEERVDERTEEQILQEEEEKAKQEAEMAEEAAKEEERRKNNASAAALTLEIVGDLPHADVKPPENILFVCKLNPVTRSDDLELIFSRFGKICSCEVIRDKKYAFIEFEEREAAEKAYSKMQNVLIDDRRIWVDFSQSVSKLHSVWVKGRTGRAPSSSAPSGPSRGPSGGRSGPGHHSRSAVRAYPGMNTDHVLVDLGDMPSRDERRDERRDDRRAYRDDRDRHDRRPRESHDRYGDRHDRTRSDRDHDRHRSDRDRDRYRSDRHRWDRYASDRDRPDRHKSDRDRDRDRYASRSDSRSYDRGSSRNDHRDIHSTRSFERRPSRSP